MKINKKSKKIIYKTNQHHKAKNFRTTYPAMKKKKTNLKAKFSTTKKKTKDPAKKGHARQ